MIIKTYQAANMQEAIQKIKKDLGEEAVIVSTRKVRKGPFFSFFKKEVLEVTAALDEKSEGKRNFKEILSKSSGERRSGTRDVEERLRKLENMIAVLGERGIHDIVNSIREDIRGLKDALTYVRESDIDVTRLPLNVARHFKLMCEVGIERRYAFKIAMALSENVRGSGFASEDSLLDYLSIVLSQFFRTEEPSGKMVVLVGPTGVGKTTTIAKLSAIYKLKMNRNVGIITTDTYRIAAVDQLMTYAKIMDIPIKVSVSKSDLREALAEFNGMDYVFVDTVGRSQKNLERLGEIFDLFSGERDTYVSLVISLNTKESDVLEVFKVFSRIPINSVIFTKVDETNTPGSMLNLVVKMKKPVSFVSFGQDVPEDIMVAEPLKLASLIIRKGSGYGRPG